MEGQTPQPRRSFVKEILALVVGGTISLFPLVTGAIVFFDPLRRRKKHDSEGNGGAGLDGYFRLASLDSLPADGTPQYVKVIADRTDAWTYFPSTPVGAVFLQKGADGSVTAFNVICPHLGCAVDYDRAGNHYTCPCHKSLFTLEGQRSADSPSPRDLDRLDAKVRDGEVWVKFQNFRTGTAEQIGEA